MAKNRTDQGSGLDVQRLTFDNLTSIPRRNDILFLSDYLQEQHLYAKGYASEGLTMFSSWNDMAASKTSQAEAATALDAFLLGTPVLKARTPAASAPVIERSSIILKALDSTGDPALIGEDQTSRKYATGNPIQSKEKLPGLKASSAHAHLTGRNVNTKDSFGNKEKPKGTKKRKDERVGSDEEHLKRLQERRERKRLKKSIMRSPARESDSEKENPARCTKKKSDKKNRTKLPNFALMHGFTATNVGKSRITLEPLLRNVGVFKKGKASCALKTGGLTTKKRSDHNVCFSEARFLGTAKAKAIKKTDLKSLSASSSTSDEALKNRIPVKRNKNLPAFKKSKCIDKTSGESVEDPNCGDTTDRSVSPTTEDRHPYDPANSIMWDIERESHVEESEVGCRQGTIVLSFPHDVLARGDQTEEQAVLGVRADISPGKPDAAIKTPDNSLHPSHSASRVVREQHKAQGNGNHFSKYFLPEITILKEADGHERQDLYEGCRSATLPVPEPRRETKPNRYMFCQSPPSIEARLASPTLSKMISLNLVDELPAQYDTFSLADVRSVFEDATMDLDDYGAFHLDAPQEPDFRPRSDNECIAFKLGLHSMQQENPDFSIVSGNVIEYDFDFEEPPVDSCRLPGRQNINFALDGGCDVALSDWNVDQGWYDTGCMTYEPASGNETDSRVASSDAPNLSMPSSFEDDNCSGFSPMIDHFSQGRNLLYGLDHGHTRVSNAEAEVVKLLKRNHWLPHRL